MANETLILALVLIIIYAIIVLYLKRSGLMERYNMSLWGPVLMWKTERGKGLIDKLARRKRFWWHFGTVSFALMLFFMIILVFMLISSAQMAAEVPKSQAMGPTKILALPGINPLLPFWYSLIALIVAVVVHEFSHGILTRVGGLKVNSLGILFFVIPIGAFVEPDEAQMETASKKVRRRIYSAGPGMNFFAALICALIFSWGFMASLTPAHDGIMVQDVTQGYPAEKAGIRPGMIIYSMNLTHYNNTTGTYDYKERSIRDYGDFFDILHNSKVNDTLTVYVYYKGRNIVFHNITLANRYNVTGLEEDNGTGFLGVGPIDHEGLLHTLDAPVRSGYESAKGDGAKGTTYAVFNILFYTTFLPLQTWLMPFHSPVTDAYTIQGPLSILPPNIFWALANLFYYVFWINLLVGTFNVLPIVPLDGGVPFRDLIHSALGRIIKRKDIAEGAANATSIAVSLLLVGLIVWIVIAPFLA